MEGITILNQVVVMDKAEWVGIALFVTVMLMFLSGVSTSFTAKSDSMIGFVVSTAIFAISTISFFIICIMQPEVETDRYRYEVIIDESVQFTDVYEKYKVIEQRGEIWVLEDKEN